MSGEEFGSSPVTEMKRPRKSSFTRCVNPTDLGVLGVRCPEKSIF